jgi:hypothetical protein
MDADKPWLEQSPQALPPPDDPDQWFIAFSWSSDGQKLAGWQRRAEIFTSGIILYSFASRHYEPLTDFGERPVWLADHRRLLFQHHDKLYRLDSETKETREVMSVAPHSFQSFSLSRDDQWIYFTLASTEADIWLIGRRNTELSTVMARLESGGEHGPAATPRPHP